MELVKNSLIDAWVVCATNRLPGVSKAFSLTVHSAFGANKKVSFTNHYSYEAKFGLFTDQPHLLSFKQPELHVPPHEQRYIGLQFAPLHGESRANAEAQGSTTVLVFVNNEDDKNEECMEITIYYSVRAR